MLEDRCPLCAKGQTHTEFEHGLKIAEAIAQKLDEAAATEAKRENDVSAAQARLTLVQERAAELLASLTAIRNRVDFFFGQLQRFGFERSAARTRVSTRLAEQRGAVEGAQRDLRILETMQQSQELAKVQKLEVDVRTRVTRLEERLGRARKAQSAAQSLYDASRRAAGEILDQRLERVLPLMSELYHRLRPHPIWHDLEYKIRGDVQRFLKLQVGEELNPQFLFSSGQRRATGLAFLLSVNVSLAWSKWRSILLDDPVQHIDDFRAIHLAELMAALVATGRQIICAVEDAALADMLCRRLPINRLGDGKRITLGPNEDGVLSMLQERQLSSLMPISLLGDEAQRA